MFKLNLAIVLNTQRSNKKGEFPLRIRTTINRVVSYHPLGIMITKEQWSGTEVVKHPDRTKMNSIIRNKVSEIEKIHYANAIAGIQTVHRAKKLTNPTFNEYANKIIKDQTGTLSPGRIGQKNVYTKKFAEFNSSIRLTDITKDTLIAFEAFCRGRLNSNNTIYSNTSFVKSILNEAVRDGYLTSSPANGFKRTKYVDPMRIVLSKEELQRIEDFADNKANPKVLRNVAAWFIFSCHTGLRYGDMVRFKGFINNMLLIQTEKTKEIVSLPLTPNIIKAHKRLEDAIISNQKMNLYLKVLAESLGIEKRVTVHLGRHFFGVNWLESGGEILQLMKLMGHSNIKMTQKYSKISTRFLHSEMMRVLG
jgi:integrase/recombinase XerD